MTAVHALFVYSVRSLLFTAGSFLTLETLLCDASDKKTVLHNWYSINPGIPNTLLIEK